MIPIPSADTIKLVLATLAVIWFFGYSLHERHVGEKIQAAADTKVAAAQVVHDQEVIAKAEALYGPTITALKAQLAAQPAADAPHLWVCQPRRSANVPAVHDRPGSVPAPAEAAGESAVVQGPDLGPTLDKRFGDDDARWEAARATIQACVQSGRCGVIQRAQH